MGNAQYVLVNLGNYRSDYFIEIRPGVCVIFFVIVDSQTIIISLQIVFGFFNDLFEKSVYFSMIKFSSINLHVVALC